MADVEKPIKMTESVVKKLEEVFALDGSVEEACYYANISRQSYYNWIKSFPDMLERFDSLRQRPFLKARQTVVKSLDNPEMALKYLERKKKDEFSTRQDITSNNEVIKIIPLLSLDEIRQHNSNPEDNQTNKPN